MPSPKTSRSTAEIESASAHDSAANDPSGTTRQVPPAAPCARSWFWPILGLGLLTRLIAFAWNDRLFGDVNLYALVARQWSETGRLDYPGKFDFFDPTPYLTLSSPVSQHPPAWSWLAGLLASLPVGLDEFNALKILGLLCGLAVIALGMALARSLLQPPQAPVIGTASAQPQESFVNARITVVGLVLALHPMLVDFSANGSPYIAVAAGALAVALAILANDRPDWLRALLAGFGATLAWQVHGAGMLLVPAGLFGLALNPHPGTRSRLRLLTGYLVTTALLLTPLLAWNYTHFGTLLHSTSTFYLPGKLGLVAIQDDPSGIHYAVGALGWQHVGPYLSLALASSGHFLLHLGLETGVFGLGLAAFFGFTLWRTPAAQRRSLLSLLAVVLAIVAPCLGWPEFKYRFLVLILPFVLILATLGGAQLLNQLRHRAAIRALLATTTLACLAFWAVQIALTGSPAKYYAYDREHLRDYAQMRAAAAYLKTQPPGVLIAFSDPLDGGTEATWWHHHPTVSVRGIAPDSLHRLIRDFKPAYLLLSPSRRGEVPPSAQLSFENAGFLVYTLPAAAGK